MLNRQETNGEELPTTSRSKSFGANVLKLLSSKVASQAIVLAAAPMLTRLFSPDSFGVRQIFVSIASPFIVIASLRYELSIPLSKDEKEASTSFTLSLFLTLIFSILVLALVPFGKREIAKWFKSPELNSFLWLLPIVVFISSLRNSLRYWAAREERFGAIAWSDFGSALGIGLAPIAWAIVIGASTAGLFTGYFAGIIFGALALVLLLCRKLISQIRNSDLSFETIWKWAKLHRKFPTFSTWSGLLNNLSMQSPAIILGLYFSKTAVGYYSLGYRLISLPISLLGGSIAQVFFPTAAREYNETGTLSRIVSSMFRRLVQIGVFPLVALGFLGAPLFGLVFGEKWIEAGIYTQIMSGWMILVFFASPLSATFSVLGRQGTGLAFNIALMTGRIFALLLGAQTGNPRITLAAFTIVGVIVWSLLLCWILRNSEVSLRWGAKIFLKYAGLSSLLLLPAGCFAWFLGNMPAVLASLSFAAICYAYGLYRFEPDLRNVAAKILTGRISSGRWSKKETSI